NLQILLLAAHFKIKITLSNYPTGNTPNPLGQTDEYGNPIGHTGAGHTTGTGAGTGHQQQQGHGGLGGVLHRSGSSSSSSSEDDGEGGRRKKGIKEKIKEKIPGGHKDQSTQPGCGGTTGGYGQPQEKKGVMEKIKEKLPGSQN
ncbi:hypothetical protein ACQCRO_27745, partial [Ralstonia pseudosolanacearum]|uniref:hypothetical protein n=1 Tax=Ralstonia pseudosolanacearum TaxID=1310165 RepID=UPI003CED0A8B